MSNYVKQLKDFKRYMNACYVVFMENGDNDDVDGFYTHDFEITWRGKKVVIANGADSFTEIERIIQCEIDECEEEGL